MITKVYGTANSIEIIFTYVEGDKWEVDVPTNKEGAWIVALYAENDIGNIGYLCKILFAITGHQMKIVVVDDGYATGAISRCEYEGIFTNSEPGITTPERGYKLEYILCDRNGDR